MFKNLAKCVIKEMYDKRPLESLDSFINDITYFRITFLLFRDYVRLLTKQIIQYQKFSGMHMYNLGTK